MRRSSIALFAFLQRTLARQPGFSYHDDLLAYPQFEVVFSEGYVREHEAQSLLDRSNPHSTSSATFSTQSDIAQRIIDPEDPNPDTGFVPSETFEIMNLPPSRYLCSIPVLQASVPENQTATELAKAEEAKELARASERGWDLLKGLDGDCIYFMSGWWSYRFCYNRDIAQFHALARVPDGSPPVQDPTTVAYVLGRVPQASDNQINAGQIEGQPRNAAKVPASRPPNSELQVKGDQRYLVQRLEGGTVCDLTGRERTIEVQYHCVPGMKTDRIGWIKEVTTCAYLMVVNTPRLCADVAFLPPQETTANSISCRLIVDADQSEPEYLGKAIDAKPVTEHTQEKQAQSSDSIPSSDIPAEVKPPVVIGGIRVGAKTVLGSEGDSKSPLKLELPRNYLRRERPHPARQIEVIAAANSKSEGGGVEVMTKEELEELGLQPEFVEQMKRQLEEMAGDRGWKLEVVEAEDETEPRQIRGIVDVDSDEGEGEGEVKGKEADAKGNSGSEEQFFHEEL